MITKRLKTIFAISIPIFIAHGLEEYFTGFYAVDSHFKFFFGSLDTMSVAQATFLVFQIMFWIALAVFTFLIASEKWRMRVMILPGLIYIYELHHFWSALSIGGYYSGMITALAFPIVGFVFWKELLTHKKTI